MNNSDILYVKEGPIAKIILNRPNKMNSYTVEMNDIFKRSVMNASKDKNIRVIIITGTGRAFCSGADVKTLSERFDQPDTDDMLRHVLRSRTSVVSLLRKCNKPVIAAVNGLAAGGGLIWRWPAIYGLLPIEPGFQKSTSAEDWCPRPAALICYLV